jgi:DNA-binding transcriptional ArsR family regulator
MLNTASGRGPKTRGRPRASASGELDAAFAALADPTRRAIVARLATGDATVLELAQPFAISLPAISRHLKVLEHAGLISRGREAQRRPCQLRPEALREVSAWADHTRQAWEARLDRLDEYLKHVQAKQANQANQANRQPKETKRESHDHGRKKR